MYVFMKFLNNNKKYQKKKEEKKRKGEEEQLNLHIEPQRMDK